MKHHRFFRSWTWIDFALLVGAVMTIFLGLIASH